MKPRPLIVSSIRDILQANRQPGRAEETVALIEQFFDLVMVHGDPEFTALDESFPLARAIADKTAYTGFVAPPPSPPPEERFDVVVSWGGGAAAGELLNAAATAAERLSSKLARWCIITGPNLPSTQLAATLPAGVALFQFRKDFPALLAGARLSISQAGYNTVCDILRAKCRAVVVPFAGKGETEQLMRAKRLAELGLARLIHEQDLTADTLASAIANPLAAPPDHNLDLEGAARTARLLRERV
jgi:predicted glycosyltransferase